MRIRVFDCDRITSIAADHRHVIESGVVSHSLLLFYLCIDATNASSLTRCAPVAPLAPVCAVALQKSPSTAVESEKCDRMVCFGQKDIHSILISSIWNTYDCAFGLNISLVINCHAYIQWYYLKHLLHVIFFLYWNISFKISLQSLSFRKSPEGSDWPADPVRCDWPNTSRVCRKCDAPYRKLQIAN